MAEFERKDLAYGGKYHSYGWTKEYNKNATVADCIPDCTTLVIMVCWIFGLPLPVGSIPSASEWHLHLINGWKKRSFDRNSLKRGDIIQWVNRCHVAIVDKVENGQIFLHCSWYTGQNGKAKIDEHTFDPRTQFSSTQEVNDFMLANYSYRFYHYCTLDDEIKGAGGEPENVLYLATVVEPVEENGSVDQINVLSNEQNIRSSASKEDDPNIVGVARSGYYNVLSQTENDGYTWYEVKKGLFIAGVAGRVVFSPKQSDPIRDLRKLLNDVENEFNNLTEENEKQKEIIRQVHELTKMEE